MLYITTRDDRDAHTAYKTLHADTAADGGLYVPFKLPLFAREDLREFKQLTFGQNVAKLLNLFFSVRLTDWDVDSAIGRMPIRIAALNSKVFCAELWHNLESKYAYLERRLFAKLAPEVTGVTDWAKIGIHIAVLFAVYGQALQQDALTTLQTFDISVSVGDFTAPMAAIYAKKMGLPIGNIVLCDQDNSAMWDLLNRGEFGTSLLNPQRKLGAERLIQNAFGTEEAGRFHTVCDKHGVYIVPEENIAHISAGLFASVVGETRINTTINSIYRTSQYLVTPQGAICHAGLQDFRAKAGESSITFLLDYDAPATCQNALIRATGLSAKDILSLQSGS